MEQGSEIPEMRLWTALLGSMEHLSLGLAGYWLENGLKANYFSIVKAFNYYKLNTHFPFHKNSTKAVQFCKIVRKGKDWLAMHEGIYDGLIIPIVKSLEHWKTYDKHKTEWKSYTIYFPLIVLNSEIYSINSKQSPIKIDKVNNVSFIREIHSKTLKDTYLVDFVNKQGLENFIKDHITNFVEEFIKAIKWSIGYPL